MKPKPQTPPPQSAAELAAEFERQREEQRTVAVLLSTRAAERKKLLLTGTDADVMEHDKHSVALEMRRDRAAARIEAIRAEHPIAMARELEAEKVALRADAQRQREAGCAAYLRVETKLRELIADLAVIFAADGAIASANANLPESAVPLRPCEADFRWLDGVASRTELVPQRAPKNGLVHRPGTSNSEDSDVVGTTTRVIPGRAAVRPEPLYDVLACPALRPGDAPLRVPGTPVSPFHGHAVKTLKPAAPLPADDAPAATHSAAPDAGSAALRVAGAGH